jgi:hypothetical protein
MGEREYGNHSFGRPLRDLLVEMTEEAVDIAAWGSIALAAHPDDAEAAAAIRCAESHARRAWQQLRSVIERTRDGLATRDDDPADAEDVEP